MNAKAYPSCYPLALNTYIGKEGFRSEPLKLPHMAIGFVHYGVGMLFVEDKRSEPLRDGSYFCIAPDDGSFEWMADPSHSLKLSLLEFSATSVNGETTEADIPSLLAKGGIGSSAPAVTEGLLTSLMLAMNNDTAAKHIRRQLTLYELLLHFYSLMQAKDKGGYESLQSTIEYMEQRMFKPFPLSELPKLAGMTQSSYCRAFKKLTGMTPGGYLTQLRMLRAKELMLDAQATLRDIAISVGFQDELYFSRVFKKTEGVSPSVYLKRRDRKIAVVSSLMLQDHLLALGILPIAAPSFPNYYTTPSGFPSYLHDRLVGTVPLDAERPIRSSDVVPLGADLILRTKLRHDGADRHWGENSGAILIDHFTSWEQYFRTIAALVDRKPEAERVIRHMSAVEQEARRKLAHVANLGRWVVVRLLPGNCRLYGVKEHALIDLMFNRLPFRPDERLKHGSYLNDAFDRLVSLDPENILVVWSEEPVINSFASDPRWQSLRAVRESRVYYPDSREWGPWGPIGREHLIKAMGRFFGRQ